MSYISNTASDKKQMLEAIGVNSIDDLFTPIPQSIRSKASINIPSRLDQISLIRRMKELSYQNVNADITPCFLGGGIYDHYVPPTVSAITGRSEFYTSYTPYQPELSQGTLQSIFEFQTLVCELFQMDVANASMYDGATALAEAMIMACDLKNRRRVLVSKCVSPFYRSVLETYAHHSAIEIEYVPMHEGVTDISSLNAQASSDHATILMQQPNFYGNIEDAAAIRTAADAAGALLVVSVDPISLSIMAPPGEYGADIVVAEGQSLGCPLGLGGPLLGLFACKTEFMRRLPGRIVGQTTDADGKRAFVMTLRTREQDIRRERATSNICTNEALYALGAAVYLATMGKNGMQEIGSLCLHKSHYLSSKISEIPGFSLAFPKAHFFKEFVINCPVPAHSVNKVLWKHGIIGGLEMENSDETSASQLMLCVTENRTKQEMDKVVAALAQISSEPSEIHN